MIGKYKYSKFLILILILICFQTLLFAQDADRNSGLYLTFNLQRTFHTSTYFEIISDNKIFTHDPEQSVTSTSAYYLEVGYFILPKRIALGLSISLESNSTFGVAYFPYYFNLKYMLSEDRNTIFIFSDIGKITRLADNNAIGNAFNFGLGKKLFFTEKLALNFAVAYSIRNIAYKSAYASVEFSRYADQYLLKAHGIELRLGLFF